MLHAAIDDQFTLGILQWFCKESTITRAIITGQAIAVTDVSLDDIPDEVVDTSLKCVQEYFKPDAWVLVQQAGKILLLYHY